MNEQNFQQDQQNAIFFNQKVRSRVTSYGRLERIKDDRQLEQQMEEEELAYSQSALGGGFDGRIGDQSSRGRSFKYSRPMTINNRSEKWDKESNYDNITIEMPLNLDDDNNFDNELAQMNQIDEVSLDSFQLIAKDDDMMDGGTGNLLDQGEEEEEKFIQKELLLAKFQQQIELNNEFEQILKVVEEGIGGEILDMNQQIINQQLQNISNNTGYNGGQTRRNGQQ